MTSPDRFDLSEVRAALGEQGHPWQAGETPLTRMSPESRNIRLGVPLPDDAEQAEIESRAGNARALLAEARGAAVGAPASFDARNVSGANYVTGVRDQGSCGSCVAFGSVAVLETTAAYDRRQPNMELNLSEAHLFYTHGKTKGVTCDTGWLPKPALEMCRDIGITYEEYFPYTPGNSGGAVLNADWPNRLARAVQTADVTGDPAKIKQQIADHGAVTACFKVFNDFFGYKSGVYKHVSGALAGGHCVALIGYDDAQGCWIAKNSWGPSWGDGGFFKIAYGECDIEAWQNIGVTGVRLRAWTGYAKVLGLWSNDAARNSWAYIENYGWHKLADSSDQSTNTMLSEALAAKVSSRQVNAFADNGSVETLYVY